jgi:transcriptional regulator with XRE-family HTH domain
MSQEEVAAQIGLSRPQLANALQGRYGLSPIAARRLVQWLKAPSRPDRNIQKAA